MTTLLNEKVSSQEFKAIETHLTKFFSKFKMDVIFRDHFQDRVNDERNKNPITRATLVDIFNKLMQEKNYRKLAGMKFGQEGLMIYKDVNFVYTLDKVKDRIQLRFITAMSKDRFVSNSSADYTLRLESMMSYYSKVIETLT